MTDHLLITIGSPKGVIASTDGGRTWAASDHPGGLTLVTHQSGDGGSDQLTCRCLNALFDEPCWHRDAIHSLFAVTRSLKA